jgi:hypothetical protein
VPALGAFDPETFGGDYEVIDQDKFRKSHPSTLEAEQVYQQARCAFEYNNDPHTALALMDRAIATNDTDPGLHLHRAMYALRADRIGTALRACDDIIAIDWDPQRQRVARYLRGRIRGHSGDVAGAQDDLRTILRDPSCGGRLAAAARKASKTIARRGRLKFGPNDVSPMSWMPDAFRYSGIL